MNKGFAIFLQNLRIAYFSIRSQMLRAILTILIIAIGITALVGILTAIDAIKSSITDEFTNMGANTFTLIRKYNSEVGNETARFKEIEYREANDFINTFDFPSVKSVHAVVDFTATVKFKSEKTNPNVQIIGADENYIFTSGYQIEEGRNSTSTDVTSNTRVVLIGAEIAKTLFERGSPLEKLINIKGGKYRVVGVLKEKGNASGFGGDRLCIIPINVARQQFPYDNRTYTASVMVTSQEDMTAAISEATGLFRNIRGDKLSDENSFRIRRSDNLATILIENLSYVTVAATVIGLITLLGAAIGLMNIMLVSVTERTKEIGTRKAIGAKIKTIRSQFLIEAILICQLGGAVGIVLGIAIGNVTSLLIGTSFIIPWAWILLGVVLCLVTGVAAGYYPAQKAAALDPVEALRYE